MNRKKSYTHVIDAIFPIAIFFVFAASSMAVLLLAARIYSNITSDSAGHDSSRTAFAYCLQKVRQSDVAGGLSVEQIDGVDCLVLRSNTEENSEGVSFDTYIYAYEGVLRELLLRNGVSAPLSGGSAIVEVREFSVVQSEDGLIRFSIISEDGQVYDMTLTERSRP